MRLSLFQDVITQTFAEKIKVRKISTEKVDVKKGVMKLSA